MSSSSGMEVDVQHPKQREKSIVESADQKRPKLDCAQWWDTGALFRCKDYLIVFLAALDSATLSAPPRVQAVSFVPPDQRWYPGKCPIDMGFVVVGSKLYGFGGHYGGFAWRSDEKDDPDYVPFPLDILVCDLKQVSCSDSPGDVRNCQLEKSGFLLNSLKPRPFLVPYKDEKIFVFTAGYPMYLGDESAPDFAPLEVFHLSDGSVRTLAVPPFWKGASDGSFPQFDCHLVRGSELYVHVYVGTNDPPCLYCLDMETLAWRTYHHEEDIVRMDLDVVMGKEKEEDDDHVHDSEEESEEEDSEEEDEDEAGDDDSKELEAEKEKTRSLFARRVLKDACWPGWPSLNWYHHGKVFLLSKSKKHDYRVTLSVKNFDEDDMVQPSQIPENGLFEFLKEVDFSVLDGLVAPFDKYDTDVFCLYLWCESPQGQFIRFCKFRLVVVYDSAAGTEEPVPRYDFEVLARMDDAGGVYIPQLDDGMIVRVFTPVANIEVDPRSFHQHMLPCV